MIFIKSAGITELFIEIILIDPVKKTHAVSLYTHQSVIKI